MTESGYRPRYSESAIRQLRKMDRQTALLITRWVRKNLDGIADPRRIGKPLKGGLNLYWRYRVGDYRILAEIVDSEFVIDIVKIGHRRDVYE